MSQSPFKLELPEGWEDQTVYSFRGPEDGGREHSLTLILNRHLRHEYISDFAREHIDPITETFQGIEVLKDEEVTIEEGNQAHEFVYKWIPSEGMTLFTKYVFVIKDNMGYVFSCEFSKRTYKTVGSMMKNVIEALVPGTYEHPEEV